MTPTQIGTRADCLHVADGRPTINEGLERAQKQYERVMAAPPIATPLEAVRNALTSWVYAMQCFEAIGAKRIGPDTLVQELLLDTNGVDVVVRKRYTPRELVVVAFNVVFATLGVLAIAADSALDSLGPRRVEDMSEVGALRTIVYMLRCAFAHDPLTPTWECRKDYRGRFEIPSIHVAVDFAALDGKTLTPGDLGGLGAITRIIELCIVTLESKG